MIPVKFNRKKNLDSLNNRQGLSECEQDFTNGQNGQDYSPTPLLSIFLAFTPLQERSINRYLNGLCIHHQRPV